MNQFFFRSWWFNKPFYYVNWLTDGYVIVHLGWLQMELSRPTKHAPELGAGVADEDQNTVAPSGQRKPLACFVRARRKHEHT